MALKDDLPKLELAMELAFNVHRLRHNRELLEIHEGNLLKYVDIDLKAQLTPMAYESARHRIAPINILKKIIEKLSSVYDTPPVRKAILADGKEAGDVDQQVLDWYERKFDMDQEGLHANKDFNLFKTFAYEPFLDKGHPKLRVIPSDRFFVYSDDPVNPLRVTHFVKIMGTIYHAETAQWRMLYIAYTADEIIAFHKGDDIAVDFMKKNNMDGTNPYKRIPFAYAARSKVDIIPQVDSDTLSMAKLIPTLLTDLNYAVMYQSFSILYTIDAAISGVRAPNGIVELKSDPSSGKEPKIGSIKPEVDTDKVITLIRTELTMWMESRNIKPGGMGELQLKVAASGISKAIDEMDTSQDRKKQVPFLQAAEADLFDLVLNHMHPVWVRSVPHFEMKSLASNGVKVHTEFSEQRPVIDPSQAVLDQAAAITAGIQSKAGAIRALHPDWEDAQVEKLLQEIADEKTTAVKNAQAVMANIVPASADQEVVDPSGSGDTNPSGANLPNATEDPSPSQATYLENLTNY